MAMMYRHDADEALTFFKEIPKDSIETNGCSYCAARFEIGMWAALDAGDIQLADEIAPKIYKALNNRKSFGTLVMYHVWKNDTTMINQLISDARNHPKYDPEWEYLNYLAGRLYLVRNEPKLASVYFQKAIGQYDSNSDRMKSKCYYFENQLDQALAIHKKLLKEFPDLSIIQIETGMIYARQGNVTEAKKIIDKLETGKHGFDYGSIEYHQARIYALMGELDTAVNLLDKAIAQGFKYDLWITFDHDPDLMGLKDHPGYKRLMSKFE
jgi:tetratricopeptide (TPR) repeat protein